MKKVSNQQYNEAYNSIDNRKIMNFAVKPFSRLIDEDDLESCKLMGLWVALQKYSKRRKTKFTSYLKSRVRWECLHYLIKNKTRIKFSRISEIGVSDNLAELEMKEILDNLSDEAQNLIYQRFTLDLTYKQIGRANGYSHETARKKLKKVLEELRQII